MQIASPRGITDGNTLPERPSSGFRISLQSVDHFTFLILLSLTLIFPVQQRWYLRYAILALYVVVRIVNLACNKRLLLNFYNLHLPLAFALFGALYCLYGVFVGNPSVPQAVPLHVVYPLILGFLAGTCTLDEAKKASTALFILCGIDTILILGVTILKLLGFEHIPLFDDALIGVDNGYTKLGFPLLNILCFSVPLFMFSYRFAHRTQYRLIYYVVLGMTVIDAVITGRRAIWVVLLLSLVGLSLSRQIRFKASLQFLFLAGGGVASAFYLAGLRFDVLVEHMQAGFEFASMADNGSALARGQQFKALMSGFVDAPLFGHGLGATAARYGSVRSWTDPSSYELSYVYYLYSMGIIGVLVYGCSIVWLCKKLYLVSKEPGLTPYCIPLLAGLVGVLVAAATNPYVNVDYMFVIFIPYAFIAACAGADQRRIRTT